MAAIRELGAALRATDDCVDDLMRRLCDASLGTITTVSISLCSQHCMRCVIASGKTRRSMSTCRLSCAVFSTKGGTPADTGRQRPGTRSWRRGSMTACTVTPGWTQSRLPAPYLPCSRHVCRRRSSRMRKPPRRRSCIICGQANDDFRSVDRLFRAPTLIILRKKTAQCSSSRS